MLHSPPLSALTHTFACDYGSMRFGVPIMSQQQLSFLSTEPSAFDVNSIDDGVILDHAPGAGSASHVLSTRPVDDWVFGLGFTNWKALIDHALRTSHYELVAHESGAGALRKHGYRYAPIPRLPAMGMRYVQQRLVVMACERLGLLSRHEKMIQTGACFSHKVVFESEACHLTVKHNGVLAKFSIQADQLLFADTSKPTTQDLAEQLQQLLTASSTLSNDSNDLTFGCRAIAAQLVRVAQALR